jgi:HK97 gp10 family phage protein
MGAQVKWKIDPVKEADKLEKGVRNKVIRIAMNKASGVVKAAVVGYAPKRYGFLQKSIRIKVRNYKGKAVWVSVIGPKSDFKRNKGKRKRGEKKGTPITHRPSNYARLVEKGTKRAKARPFLKPALQQTRSQFMNTLRQSIGDQVKQLLPKK